jgi:hypothetical protein
MVDGVGSATRAGARAGYERRSRTAPDSIGTCERLRPSFRVASAGSCRTALPGHSAAASWSRSSGPSHECFFAERQYREERSSRQPRASPVGRDAAWQSPSKLLHEADQVAVAIAALSLAPRRSLGGDAAAGRPPKECFRGDADECRCLACPIPLTRRREPYPKAQPAVDATQSVAEFGL